MPPTHPASIAIEPLTRADLASAANRPGISFDGRHLSIPFFGQPHTLNETDIRRPDGTHPTALVAEVLREYIAHPPHAAPPEERWVSFREIRGAGPLITSFANNTNKTISHTFSGKLPALRLAATTHAGIPEPDLPGYDLAVIFTALPGVPIRLLFNDAEAHFPAQGTLLLRSSIETFLAPRAIFTLGTFLCGRLAGAAYHYS